MHSELALFEKIRFISARIVCCLYQLSSWFLISPLHILPLYGRMDVLLMLWTSSMNFCKYNSLTRLELPFRFSVCLFLHRISKLFIGYSVEDFKTRTFCHIDMSSSLIDFSFLCEIFRYFAIYLFKIHFSNSDL